MMTIEESLSGIMLRTGEDGCRSCPRSGVVFTVLSIFHLSSCETGRQLSSHKKPNSCQHTKPSYATKPLLCTSKKAGTRNAMTLTNTIVNMNNHAVELLRRGRYNGAMLDLRKVVLVLAGVSSRNGFLLQESSSTPPTASKMATSNTLLPHEQALWDIFVTTNPTACPIEGQKAGSGVMSMEYAFLLNLPDRRSNHHDNHLSDDENSACTAVCLYNMALCCYCEWLQNQNNEDFGLLHHALDLYEQALGIILSWRPPLSGSSFSLFIMALCKNITAIYHDMGDLVRVSTWRITLGQAIGFVDLNCVDNDSYRLLMKSTIMSRVQATNTVAGAA
jgi:hypothetical protein